MVYSGIIMPVWEISINYARSLPTLMRQTRHIPAPSSRRTVSNSVHKKLGQIDCVGLGKIFCLTFLGIWKILLSLFGTLENFVDLLAISLVLLTFLYEYLYESVRIFVWTHRASFMELSQCLRNLLASIVGRATYSRNTSSFWC